MSLWTRISGRLKRDSSRWFGRRMIRIAPSKPVVSFTFDDFPRSALYTGGEILRRHGCHGTYYASFGLMGKVAPTGEIFGREDVPELLRQGHELGCHTFDHCHAWDTPPSVFEDAILRNQRAAAEFAPALRMRSLSYPISGPRPGSKARAARYYACARGGSQTLNLGATDSRLLHSFFLERSGSDFSAVQSLLDRNAKCRGWLVFTTHDVSESPTPFGCTPAFFEKTVTAAVRSGAEVLPLFEAFSALCIDGRLARVPKSGAPV